MAIFDNAFSTYDAEGNREDLTDIIRNVDPTATPFQSNARKAKAESTLHEWQMDTYGDAVDTNAKVQGDTITAEASTPTVRVGNYTQILRRTFAVAATQEAVKSAGRASEIAHQKIKVGTLLKLDLEKSLLKNQAGVGGSTAVAAKMAGLPAWLKTNTNFDATSGADPVWSAGVPTARTDSSAVRPLTEDLLKDVVLQLVSVSEIQPTTFMVGPYNKQVISDTFEGRVPAQLNVSSPAPVAVIGAVDVYRTNYGLLSIVFNRFQRERDAFLINFDQVAIADLRPMFSKQEPAAIDGELHQVTHETTLRVENEAALAGIYDLAAFDGES